MKKSRDYLLSAAKSKSIYYELSPEERTKLKECMLSIYKDVFLACSKYGIKPMLGGGTCLGAVRHQGFIPWDDDMDLMMVRDDYNKFIDIFDRELSQDYILSVPGKKKKNKYLFGKVIKKGTVLIEDPYTEPDERDGIYIDIFPIERMPDNKFFRNVKGLLLDFIRIGVTSIYSWEAIKNLNRNIAGLWGKLFFNARYVIGLFFSIFGKYNLYNFYDYVASHCHGDKYFSIPSGRGYSKRECHPKEVFIPVQETTFEGTAAYLPHDVHAYLTNLYGDYMKVPPVEKRERHFYVKLKLPE